MSSPESSSSRIGDRGASTASCRVSLRFFSPPDRSTLSGRWSSARSQADALAPRRRARSSTSSTAPPRAASASRQHVVERHAGHLGRVLHHEVQPGRGALPRRQGEHVDAVEGDRAAEHLVAGLAHDRLPDSVLLPAPFGPITAWTSPLDTVRSMPRRISLPPAATRRSRISSVLTLSPPLDARSVTVAVGDDHVEHRHRLGGRQRRRLAGRRG